MSTTLTAYLAGVATNPQLSVAASIVADVAAASAELAGVLRTAPLDGLSGTAGTTNVQGEAQKPLDIEANRIFLRRCRANPAIAWAVSEEEDHPIRLAEGGTHGLLFDPLDGSSNLDVNVTVGSIFSIIPATSEADLLQAGKAQVAAGFVAYGPATTLVLTFGETVDLFVLSGAEFELVNDGIRIPPDMPEFSINTSRERFWNAGTRRYIGDCLAGELGPLGQRYNMRWVGSMVAEVLRILSRGGIFLYPSDSETAKRGGRLRLLYEANPMSLIVTTAGGGATTGALDLLDVPPADIHQRISVVLGSSRQVDEYTSYVARGR